MRVPWSDDEESWVRQTELTLDALHEKMPYRSRHAIVQKARKMGVELHRRELELQGIVQTEPLKTTTKDPEFDLVQLLDAADRFDFGDDPTPEQLDELLDAMATVDSALGSFSPTKERVTFSPPDPKLPVGIVFTGDWHVGAGGTELDRLRKDLKRIGETDGLWAIGMGDMIEGVGAANKASPALYHGIVNKSDLQVKLASRLAALAAGKWLALLGGNHDAMSYRATGIERARIIAREINVPFFSEAGGTVFLKLANAEYVIGVRHNGKGNSQLNTSNAQRRTFDEWPEWQNTDVICLAHLHFNDLHVPPRKGSQCVYLRSGSAKTHDDYARDKGFKPEYGMPVVVFYPDEKRLIPFRGDQMDAALRFLESERAAFRS